MNGYQRMLQQPPGRRLQRMRLIRFRCHEGSLPNRHLREFSVLRLNDSSVLCLSPRITATVRWLRKRRDQNNLSGIPITALFDKNLVE